MRWESLYGFPRAYATCRPDRKNPIDQKSANSHERSNCAPEITIPDSLLVWTTKYRYDVLGGDVGRRCRELLREISRSREMTIYAGSINRDHVHMLIGIPPHISVSRAVQYLKGKSSHKLLAEFGQLRKRYWGQHLWGRGYWVSTSGNVTDEVWKRYIEEQKPPEPDDDFNVV